MITSMPCLPYLMRHVNNNDELLVFAKVYFETCSLKDIETEEALLRYMAVASSMLPQDRPEIFRFRDNTLPENEFVLKLKSDPEIRPYSSCSKYCKEILPLGSELCKTCPYSSSYSGSNEALELSLLKYAASSYDRSHFLRDRITEAQVDVKSVFRSRTDLLNGLNETDPLPVPLALVLYKSIISMGREFDKVSDIQERLFGLQESVTTGIVKLSRSGKYDSITKLSESKRETVWKIYCDSVLGADDVFDIAQVIAECSHPLKKNPAQQELPEEFSLFGFALAKPETPGQPEETGVPQPSGDTTILSRPEDTVQVGSISDDGVADSDMSDTVTPNEGIPGTASMENKSDNAAETGASPEPSTSEYPKKPVHIAIDNPLRIPLLPSSIDFSDPETLKNNILLSESISIEVFQSSSGFLLFIIYARGCYYVCQPDSPSIREIMCNSHLLKICWQPFDLYSLCLKNGVPVKSLYSILEHELCYCPGKTSACYRDVFTKYIASYPFVEDELLYHKSMPYYKLIVARQGLDGDPTTQYSDYFRMLGNSYHRDRVLKEKDSSRLFRMGSDGVLDFLPCDNIIVKKDGYVMSVSVENLVGKAPSELFFDSLLRFRSARYSGMQIISCVANQLVLYFPAELYVSVTSHMRMSMDWYAVSTGNTRMHSFEKTRYYSSGRSLVERARKKRPLKSLVSVLGELTSRSIPGSSSAKLERISLAELGQSTGRNSAAN